MADGNGLKSPLARAVRNVTGEDHRRYLVHPAREEMAFDNLIRVKGPELGHTRDSLLMGDYYGDSPMGELLGDLIGDDDDDDDVGEYGEIGARKRQLKRINRKAKKAGLVVMPRKALMRAAAEQEQALRDAGSAASMEAAYTGQPQTAGGKLAVSRQRELMLPFQTAILAAALGSTQVVTANVQRAIQLRRFLITAGDNVAFTDASLTIGVSLIKIGSEIVFNANGVVPLQAFAALAVGVELLCQPAQTGNLVEITFVRTIGVANTATLSATGYGFSAGAR